MALLALALQLLLSFGHVHVAPQGLQAAAVADLQHPADDDHPAEGLNCDLCAVLALGVGLEALPAVTPPVPQWVASADAALVAHPVAVTRRHSPVQSRAPPAV